MSAYTDLLNRRQNMTDEERRADIEREVFGPIFRDIFGVTDAPKQDEKESP